MRTKALVLTASVVLLASSVMAQAVEYDDMYFNAKDRKKLKEKQASEAVAFSQSPASKHNKNNATSEVYADNSDVSTSYSSRNQNPEYAARINSKEAAVEEEYFASNYHPSSSYATAADFQTFNSSYNKWYNSAWIPSTYWGSSMSGFNSAYYGSYYDTWGSPWMNPYSGWSTSIGYYSGSPYSYGYSGMGMSYTFGSPYSGWGNWGMMSGIGYGAYGYGGYGYGAGYGYGGNYGYVPYADHVKNYTYGKRGAQNGVVTRGQVRNSYVNPNSTVDKGTTGTNKPVYNGTAGGRMAANSSVSAPSRGQVQNQADYYNRNWRTARQADVYGGSNSYSQPSRSSQSGSWNNNNNNNSSQTQWNRSSSFDGGRSSYSGGSHTGGSAPASSGTTGRTRVRD